MKRFIVFSLCALAAGGSTSARGLSCVVEPFQGATLPQGTVARIRVANDGSACAITLYGVPGERANPADSGLITKQPVHGRAEFVAPQAKYTPEQGYVGEDTFALEAFASGRSGQRTRLKVQVEVQVVAP